MKRITKLLALAMGMVVTLHAEAHDYVDTIDLGQFTVSGDNAGVAWFNKADSSVFSGCESSPTPMLLWSDNTLSTVGKEAIMAALMFAKSANRSISVYYDVRADGVCIYKTVTVN